jgi:hypothetical protein
MEKVSPLRNNSEAETVHPSCRMAIICPTSSIPLPVAVVTVSRARISHTGRRRSYNSQKYHCPCTTLHSTIPCPSNCARVGKALRYWHARQRRNTNCRIQPLLRTATARRESSVTLGSTAYSTGIHGLPNGHFQVCRVTYRRMMFHQNLHLETWKTCGSVS